MKSTEISFVCCIEAGRLEKQTCLMVSTLRAFGGVHADVQVYVVIGRSGPSLSKETIDFLTLHNATIIKAYTDNPARWFNFSNKIAAVTWAQKNLTTEYLGWLDSDILIYKSFLSNLTENFDFAGRCEYLPPAIHVGNEKHINYWTKVCAMAGTTLEDLPWIEMDGVDAKIRLSFNSGFFVWRRKSVFAAQYKRVFVEVLRSRIASCDNAAWFADQVIIGPIIVANQLTLKHLSFCDHRMVFDINDHNFSNEKSLGDANLIHYSKSLSGASRVIMMGRLKNECPKLYEHLVDFDKKMSDKSSVFHNFHLMRGVRTVWQKIFTMTVKPIY